ncbi:MAG: HEAT repeat domain-containing protein [Planctomycetes bacterium]|nr:HEAT repeat domain-containing protein [Planctomycetota bacterium]
MFRRACARFTASLLVLVSVTPALAGPARFGDAKSRRHDPRDRTMDVQHLELHVSFDADAKTVTGEVTLTVKPITDKARTLELDAPELHVKKVTLHDAGDLPFRHDGETLRIELPATLPSADAPKVTIAYDAKPRKGAYFVGPDEGYPSKPRQIWTQGESEDNRFWFPSYDFPNDKATSEMFATVPAGQTAVSNGQLVEITEDPKTHARTFHWRTDQPHSSYLVSLAIGEFEEVDDQFGDVPVQYFVPKGTGRETTLRSFGVTPEAMRFFSDKIGVRYPYAKYAQTCAVDFIFGGMENISATTQTANTLHGPEAEPERSSQGLVAHELAHQWWGDMLTCRDWAHIWLNEGFATYFEALFREHHDGVDEFRFDMLNAARSYLAEDSGEYRRSIVTNVYTEPMDLFDSHTYPKGGWCLNMIRGILGDALFWKSIHHYAETNAWKNVVTDDLRRAIEETTGRNLDWFFDEWLYHGGHPEFRVESEWDADTKLVRISVAQTQTVDDLTPLFRMPLDIEVRTPAETKTYPVEVSKAHHEFVFPCSEEPQMIRFDPHHRVLATLDQPRSLRELEFASSHDDDVVGRIFVAEELGKRAGDPEAGKILEVMAESDAFWAVRAAAATALGKIRGAQAAAALRVVIGDKDSRVRTAAATALGDAASDTDSVASLADRFANDGSPFVRAAAVRALAKAKAPLAGDLAVKALGVDSSGEVIRQRALDALADLGDSRAVKLATEWTAYGKPPEVRTTAAEVLGRAGEGDRRARETLEKLLDDRAFGMRRAAIAALRELGDPKAIDALAARESGEVDSRLRKSARDAVTALRARDKGGDRFSTIRDDLEKLRAEYDRLLERVESIEKRPG